MSGVQCPCEPPASATEHKHTYPVYIFMFPASTSLTCSNNPSPGNLTNFSHFSVCHFHFANNELKGYKFIHMGLKEITWVRSLSE